MINTWFALVLEAAVIVSAVTTLVPVLSGARGLSAPARAVAACSLGGIAVGLALAAGTTLAALLAQ